VLDDLMSRLREDPDYHREMSNIHKASFFDSQRRGAEKWRNGRWTCMHPQCSKETIGSHTLQKSNSLQAIAEGSTATSAVVVSPHFNPATGDTIGTNLSYANASVFPGFCGDHDRDLFLHLEETVGTPDTLGMLMQCSRTFCRERLALVHAWDTARIGCEQMVNNQNAATAARLTSMAGTPLSGISGYDETARFHYLPDRLRQIRLDASAQAMFLNSFDKIVGSIGDFFCDQTKVPQIVVKSWAVSSLLDFALSGADDIGLPGAPIPMFYFVIPRSGVTHMSAFCHIEDEPILETLLASKKIGDLKPGADGGPLFRFFEQLMINRTNHWFLRPSTWARLPDDAKARLLEDVNSHDASIYGRGSEIFPVPNGLRVIRSETWRPLAP